MKEYPNISKAIITRPGDVEWAYASEARQMLPHLRLLAEAVLEAHSKHYPQAYHVGCEACRVAREVMGCKPAQ